jgi:hypothetical protein
VVWREKHDDDHSNTIHARRINRTGELGPQFVVNPRLLPVVDAPSAAMNLAGQCVIVWTSAGRANGRIALVVRRYDAARDALTTEEQEIEELSEGPHAHPSVAIDGKGNFIVSWQSETPAGTFVCARRYGWVN